MKIAVKVLKKKVNFVNIFLYLLGVNLVTAFPCFGQSSLSLKLVNQSVISPIKIAESKQQIPDVCPPDGCIGETRGDELVMSNHPYIITPRASTRILSDKPILRWNGVSGISSYTVSLSKQEGGQWREIWRDTVNKTEVVYGGNPLLEAGEKYLIKVTAGAEYSQAEFSRLSRDKVENVRVKIDEIDKKLTGDEKVFALLRLYTDNYLFADSITLLETTVNQGSNQPEIYYTLGNLYLLMGLMPKGEAPYLKAAQLASNQGDSETLTATLKMSNALANWYILHQESKQAETLLKTLLSFGKNDVIRYKTLITLSVALVRQNRYLEAKSYLKEAINLGKTANLGKDQAEAHCLLSEVLDSLGDKEGALQEGQICQESLPTSHSDEARNL